MSDPLEDNRNSISSPALPGSPSGPEQARLVELRRFPYPFRAGLAICSDIDGTTTLKRFLTIQEFLNSEGPTTMGPGLGLEIGNSFFPYTPDDSFAYFSSRPDDRHVLETLMKSGHVDCIHSFGDGAQTRSQALRALEMLDQRGCKLDTWVDHSHARSNFGKDTSPGIGDVVGSEIYHADATLAYGVKYVWKGRGSSIVGHGVPFTAASFSRILDRAHARQTFANLVREIAKTLLARSGNRRFAIHRHNQLLHTTQLDDGQQVVEFNRSNSYWRGISYGHDSLGLAYVIRPRALRDLIASKGSMVIYTHLGIGPQSPSVIPAETQATLRNLARRYREGLIYVTTTSRLLNDHFLFRHLQWRHSVENDGWIHIELQHVEDPIRGRQPCRQEALQGITFYVPNRHKVRIFLGNVEVHPLTRNPADHTGQESVMIPRTYLAYPLVGADAGGSFES